MSENAASEDVTGGSTPGAPPDRPHSRGRSHSIGPRFGQEVILLALLLIIGAVFYSLQPALLSYYSLDNILRVSSISGVAALGMMIVILTGGIDLSVGSVMALGGALGAGLLGVAYGAANPIVLPAGLAIAAALACTGLIGAVSALAITALGVAPFVVTLGMMTVVRGLTYMFADYTVRSVPGSQITFYHPWFDWLGAGNVAGIPSQTVIFVILALLLALMLKHTAFGRNIFAVGGNIEIARLAGIRTGRVLIAVYALAGMLAGLSGMMLAAKLSSVSPLMATGYELNIITIVVVGGASLLGGRGSVLGTVLAALLLTLIDNGLDLLNVPSFYQYLVKGVILISAVAIDRWYREGGTRALNL